MPQKIITIDSQEKAVGETEVTEAFVVYNAIVSVEKIILMERMLKHIDDKILFRTQKNLAK